MVIQRTFDGTASDGNHQNEREPARPTNQATNQPTKQAMNVLWWSAPPCMALLTPHRRSDNRCSRHTAESASRTKPAKKITKATTVVQATNRQPTARHGVAIGVCSLLVHLFTARHQVSKQASKRTTNQPTNQPTNHASRGCIRVQGSRASIAFVVCLSVCLSAVR